MNDDVSEDSNDEDSNDEDREEDRNDSDDEDDSGSGNGSGDESDDEDSDYDEDDEKEKERTEKLRNQYKEFALNISMALVEARGVEIPEEKIRKNIDDLLQFHLNVIMVM